MINHFRAVLCNLQGPLTPRNPYEFLSEAYAPTDLGYLQQVWHAIFGDDPDRQGILLQAHRLVSVVAAAPELRDALTYHDPRVLHPEPPAYPITSESKTGSVVLLASGTNSQDQSGRVSRTFTVSPAGGGAHLVTETRTGRSVTGTGSITLPVTGESVLVTGTGSFTLRRYTGPTLGQALSRVTALPLQTLFEQEDPSLLQVWYKHPVSRVRLGAVACAFVSKVSTWKGL